MTNKRIPTESLEPSILTPAEREILEELRQLATKGIGEVPAELIARMERSLKWDYNDTASMRRATYFAAQDPYLRREVAAIGAEFRGAEADGLEDS